MLSILIPTYNYNCLELVKRLQKQAQIAEVPYEILVLDDCSTHPEIENTEINGLANCKFTIATSNNGRAKTRNILASQAQYDFLLFLDADAEVPDDLFLNRYLSYCNEKSIVCGGCMYNQANDNPNFTLRLHYGKHREMRSVEDRMNSLYTSFSSFNFLIPKSLFDKIGFNEKLVEYGHEDTVFGYELKLHHFNITHIDNPLIHKGLEPSSIFLEKTRKSMENLFLVSKEVKYKNINADIKVLRVYHLLNKLRLTKIYSRLFNYFSKTIERNLLGKSPSLLLFDLYKLGHLSMAYKN